MNLNEGGTGNLLFLPFQIGGERRSTCPSLARNKLEA